MLFHIHPLLCLHKGWEVLSDLQAFNMSVTFRKLPWNTNLLNFKKLTTNNFHCKLQPLKTFPPCRCQIVYAKSYESGANFERHSHVKESPPGWRRRKFRFIFQHVFTLQQSHFLRYTPPLVPNIPICRLSPLCEYNKIKNLNNFFFRILSFLSELCTCIQKQIKTVWCLGASFFLLKNQFTVNFFFFSRRDKKNKQKLRIGNSISSCFLLGFNFS